MSEERLEPQRTQAAAKLGASGTRKLYVKGPIAATLWRDDSRTVLRDSGLNVCAPPHD
jgi:hypothetical protein